MSIQVKKNNTIHSIQKIYAKSKDGVLRTIQYVYNGTLEVWRLAGEAIRSCFGSGKWLNDKPWLNDDKWKNE